MGRVYLGVCHVSYPKRAKFHGAPILGVLLYLCLHPLTQNDQIRHGNTVTHMGNGMFLGGQPRHFICTNASRGLSATTEFLVSFALENMCVTLCPNQLWTHSRKDCILIEKRQGCIYAYLKLLSLLGLLNTVLSVLLFSL